MNNLVHAGVNIRFKGVMRKRMFYLINTQLEQTVPYRFQDWIKVNNFSAMHCVVIFLGCHNWASECKHNISLVSLNCRKYMCMKCLTLKTDKHLMIIEDYNAFHSLSVHIWSSELSRYHKQCNVVFILWMLSVCQ